MFVWRMINEAKKAEIRAEAKNILDSFARALENVEVGREKVKKGVGGYREEEHGQKGDEDFRYRMFANAPEKDRDCIIVEKKKW